MLGARSLYDDFKERMRAAGMRELTPRTRPNHTQHKAAMNPLGSRVRGLWSGVEGFRKGAGFRVSGLELVSRGKQART